MTHRPHPTPRHREIGHRAPSVAVTLRTLLLASGAAFATSAWAAETDAPDASGQAIEEVVVTAQRREQSLQQVPVAVSALSAKAIEKAGITDTTQLAQMAPGLNLARNAFNMVPYIRGVGTPIASAGTDLAVATYIDGVYLPSASATIFELADIERIEVLRGPQGTLFGRNATGGAVQIVTRRPAFEPSAQVRASYENYNTYRVNAYVTGGLMPGVAASLSVHKMDQAKGWGQSLLTGADVNLKDEYGARLKVLAQPLDRLDLILAVDYDKTRSDMGVIRTANPGSLFLDGRRSSDFDFYDYRGTLPVGAGGFKEQYGGYLRAEYQITDDIKLQSTSALRYIVDRITYDQDGSPVNSAGLLLFVDNHAYQQEILLQGETGRLNWTTGVNYTEDLAKNKDLRSFTPAATATNNVRVAQLLTRSYAVFGQGTLALGEATNFTLGLRYNQDRKVLNGTQFGLPGHPLGNGTVLARAINQTADANKLTWRVGFDHRLNDSVMLYSSVSRGFKSGGFNAGNLSNPPVLPETLDALEAGFKGDFLDRRLRINGSVYGYKYKNIQLTQIVTGGTLTTNAATAESYGAELEGQFVPDVSVGRLQFRGSLTVAHGEYKKFPNGPLVLPNPAVCTPTPVQTGPATGGNRTCPADLSGHNMIRLPNWTATIGVDYAVPAFGGELEMSADLFHSGRFYWEPSNRITQRPYELLSAQVAWTTPDEKLTFRAFGRNLTDQEYGTQGAESAAGDLIGPGPPRTYGIGVTARF